MSQPLWLHIHGLHWDCSPVEVWYEACREGCGSYQTLTPAVVVVAVL